MKSCYVLTSLRTMVIAKAGPTKAHINPPFRDNQQLKI